MQYPMMPCKQRCEEEGSVTERVRGREVRGGCDGVRDKYRTYNFQILNRRSGDWPPLAHFLVAQPAHRFPARTASSRPTSSNDYCQVKSCLLSGRQNDRISISDTIHCSFFFFPLLSHVFSACFRQPFLSSRGTTATRVTHGSERWRSFVASSSSSAGCRLSRASWPKNEHLQTRDCGVWTSYRRREKLTFLAARHEAASGSTCGRPCPHLQKEFISSSLIDMVVF